MRALSLRPAALSEMRFFASSVGRPDGIARLATQCLRLELATYPKPGLVSHVDSGSHADMDAGTFRASASALEPYFVELAAAGAVGPRAPAGSLGAHVRARYADAILDGPELLHAPGARARRRHGVGGAPAEAAAGFPTLYGTGLPALRRARTRRPESPEAARVEACLALIATLEDTNLLHRGGPEGFGFARAEAARFLAAGGIARDDWFSHAQTLHRAFVARRLSPGGAADLLAMTLFVDAWEQA